MVIKDRGQVLNLDLLSEVGNIVRLFNHDVYMIQGLIVKKRGTISHARRKNLIDKKAFVKKGEVVSLPDIYPFIKTVVDDEGEVIARRKNETDKLRLVKVLENS